MNLEKELGSTAAAGLFELEVVDDVVLCEDCEF
jgi:hypothetical protein